MLKLIVLVGPAGSGKSTYAKNWLDSENDSDKKKLRINQDEQGKEHLKMFNQALLTADTHILIDRMNFNKQQRERYLKPAKEVGYKTEIIVLHEPRSVCFERMQNRKNHPTVKTDQDANNALNTFFSKYERPSQDEADVITFKYPEEVIFKPEVIICDLDGTLCNIDHRLHFMQGDKKNWPGFFADMNKDTLNEWCSTILFQMGNLFPVILASGRPDNYKKVTQEWLESYNVEYKDLFMRPRNDSRRDDIIKEIILDFEILTRYKPLFFIDDRQQVVDMWRSRGFICLQCARGDF